METWLSKKLNDIPVIDRVSGRMLGRVGQVLVLLPAARVLGITVAVESGWKKQAYLQRSDIWAFSANCILARGKMLSPLREEPENLDFPLYSPQGRLEGRICDVLIDSMGGIRGVQISKSLVEDVKNGREILPMRGNLIVGEGRAQRVLLPPGNN